MSRPVFTSGARPPRLPWQLFGAIGAGMLLLGVAAYGGGSLIVFVLLALIAGASFMIGGLGGFLFGIPKSRSENNSSQKDVKGSRAYLDNANLEEVSDWLTKIIVGLGLVEFGDLGKSLSSFGDASSSALVGLPPAAAKIAAEVTLVYFAVLGFLIAYLWARLELYASFLSFDAAERLAEEIKESVGADLGAEFADNETLRTLYTLISDNKTRRSAERNWSSLHEQYGKARIIFDKDNGNRKAAILVARYINEILHERSSPIGLREAIRQLDSFVRSREKSSKRDADYGDVLYNRSAYKALLCAAYAANQTPDDHVIASTMLEALNDLRVSVDFNQDNAAAASGDPDFNWLREFDEFKAILKQPQADNTPPTPQS